MREDQQAMIREKILRILRVWPKLNPSMLQMGLGTSLPRAMWQPVFDQLKAEGLVQEEQIAGEGNGGRAIIHTVISLTDLAQRQSA